VTQRDLATDGVSVRASVRLSVRMHIA